MIKGEMCTVMGDGKEVYEDLVKAIKSVHHTVVKAEGKELADKFIVHAGKDAMNLNHEVIEYEWNMYTLRKADEMDRPFMALL